MQTVQPYGSRYDVVIVGARCAGAATAMLLARAGARVLVVDRQKYGSDTASTHALMRPAVQQLDRWGLLDQVQAAGTPRVTRTTFHYGPEAIGIDIKPEYGVDCLCAPRRTVLDSILVDAAVAAGAEVHHDVSLEGLQQTLDGRVTGVNLKLLDGSRIAVAADIVIGADGRQSTVARQVGARIYARGTASSGYVYGYYAGLPDDGYHWYFERGTAAGVIPTSDGLSCVFTGVHRDRFVDTFRGDLKVGFLQKAAENSPALADDLGRAQLVGRLRGFVGVDGYLRQSHGPGWALVGDAGYFKDPLTAHGITDAFRDAELLARAVINGRGLAFANYQGERDALSRPLFDVTNAIAAFDWNLEQVKRLHGRLSDAMKAEAAHVAGFASAPALAA